MAWSPRTATTAPGTGGGALTFAAPGGLANDDLMLIAVYLEPASATMSWPAGFVEEASQAAADSSFVARVARKRAVSESGSYTATPSGAVYSEGIMLAYGGSSTSGTGLDATTTTGASGAEVNQITTPSITTVTAAALLVSLAFDFDVFAKTAPAGFTERAEEGTLAGGDQEQAVAGASGAKIWTTSGTSQTVGIMLALRPATATAVVAILTPMRGIL